MMNRSHGTLRRWQAAMLTSSTDLCSSLRVSPPPRTAHVTTVHTRMKEVSILW